MKRPSPSALSDWYCAQPKQDYTCADCGKVGPKHYIQPQHPYYADGREGVARCADCITAINERARQRRKEELAKLDRCEVDGCTMRGNWRAPGGVLLCGRHLKAAQREHARRMAGFGGLGLFLTVEHSREDMLRMAGGRT